MLHRLRTISEFTLLSRISGVGRDMLMVRALGANPVAETFMLAFRLLRHVRSIVAEGASTSAFASLDSTIEARRRQVPCESVYREVPITVDAANGLGLLVIFTLSVYSVILQFGGAWTKPS